MNSDTPAEINVPAINVPPFSIRTQLALAILNKEGMLLRI